MRFKSKFFKNDQERKQIARNKVDSWNKGSPWFAWHPVKLETEGADVVWLEIVNRSYPGSRVGSDQKTLWKGSQVVYKEIIRKPIVATGIY